MLGDWVPAGDDCVACAEIYCDRHNLLFRARAQRRKRGSCFCCAEMVDSFLFGYMYLKADYEVFLKRGVPRGGSAVGRGVALCFSLFSIIKGIY